MNRKGISTQVIVLAVIALVAVAAAADIYLSYAGKQATTVTTTQTTTNTLTSTSTQTTTATVTQTLPPGQLTVFAAASLVNIMPNISAAFNRFYNANITFNYAGSGALATQIVQGFPCDVFLSASPTYMTQVANASLLYNKSVLFAKNSLIVMVAKSSASKVTSIADLAKSGVRVELEDKSVPAGAYSLTILSNIESTWGNSSSPAYVGPQYANFSKAVLANVISYDTDVEQTVTKIVTGTADAGIVYKTDAIAQAANINFITIPDSVNVVASYPAGVISTSQHLVLAQQFVNFLTSAQGQQILNNFGFVSP
ncbi:MAG TPA: molybdate ABC transporter substrate-binding protein [Conexivisphaerales archaeon]|nr:molybdate ABC transporter substrate-binding protein [Conexivisphaerales archaeon]